MKQTLYLDTSIIGGYFDEEFEEETHALWKLQSIGVYHFVSSLIALDEIQYAPQEVGILFAETFNREDLLSVTEESEKLALLYLQHGVVPEKCYNDALHVATCVVAGIGLLASWNFKHLANLQRENAFNGVNLLRGYPSVRILSPKSLIYGHQN